MNIDAEVKASSIMAVHDSNGKHVEGVATVSVYPHTFQIVLSRDVATKIEEMILDDAEKQMRKILR